MLEFLMRAENYLTFKTLIVLANQFGIIALAETWLNDSVTNYEILPHGYTFHPKVRDFRKREGGVLLAFTEDIPVEAFNINVHGLELATVFIKIILVSV